MYDTLRLITRRLAYGLALLGFTGLLILSMMVVADILLRGLADLPLKGVNDISAMVMAVVIAACIPQSLLLKQSISVEVLGQIFGGRLRLLFDLIASIAVLIFFSLMAWQFLPYSASILDSGERTWVLHWPVGPWWYVVTAFFFVSVFAQIMVVIDDALSLVLGHPWPLGPHSAQGEQ